MTEMKRSSRQNQRGSAMLIVFVFAAIVAISLFAEMPVVIFEAQRNREQLLVDRGNEYIQAVKLYRRKTGQFPPNLEALEKTNQIRFLRKKFKDPFTDKADWRLLHAGPNGTLIDSKLKLAQTVTGAGNSALGTFNTNGANQSSPFGGTTPGNTGFSSNSNSPFGSNANTGFATNGSGFAPPSNAYIPPTNNPNLLNNNQQPGGFTGGYGANGIDPTQVLQNNQQAVQNGFAQPLPNPDGTVQVRNLGAQRSAVPIGTNGSATGGIDPTQSGYSAPVAQTNNFQNATSPANPNTAVSGLISNPNPATPQSNSFSNAGNNSSPFATTRNNANSAFGNNAFGASSNGGSSNNGSFNSSSGFSSSTSGFGNVQSGGLAGVASKVERHSIKVVNDQQDYSLWEFYYDPTKDPAMNAAGAAVSQGGAGGAVGQPGNSPLQTGNSFGQQNGAANQSSPFGQASPFGSQSGAAGTSSGNSNGGFGSSSGFPNGNNTNAPSAQQQTLVPPSPQPPPP